MRAKTWRQFGLVAFAFATVVLGVAAASASAAPRWDAYLHHYPTHLEPGGTGYYVIGVRNGGDTASAGVVTVTNSLPAGVEATAMAGTGWTCPTPAALAGNPTPTCTRATAVSAGTTSSIRVTVNVAANAGPTVTSRVAVSGGGATDAGVAEDLGVVSATPAPAGIVAGSFEAELSDYQAGGHPDSRVSFRLATEMAAVQSPLFPPQVVVKGGAPKDIVVDIPKGVLGNPRGLPRCTPSQLTPPGFDECPGAAQVGYTELYTIQSGLPVNPPIRAAVYNMVPERGEVAKFGLRASGALNAYISIRVRTDGDYGLTATIRNIFDGWPLWGSDLVLWGVPSDPANDPQRRCYGSGDPGRFGCEATSPLRPFMIAPAECGVDGVTSIKVRPWQNPTESGWSSAASAPQQVTGCEKQTFRPTLDIWTDTSAHGKPMGLSVDIRVPHETENPDGLFTPPLKDATVTLPEGVTVSSSSWYGLEGCSDAQLGLGTTEPARCPNGSRIGSVSLESPVLEETLSGGIYLGTQLSNDPASGDLFRISLELINEERGLVIKIPGKIHVDEGTGRITARFRDNPQLPFSRLSLRFKGGDRAPLTTPQQCGPATTTGQLTGWGVSQPAHVTSTFTVTRDGSGNPCPLGFSPSFAAGTIDPSAGRASAFTLSFGRDDDDADLRNLTVRMPPGLLARIADVPTLCPDAKAATGTCAETSRIGSVTAATGAGANPPSLPGRVYITDGYKGQPFGLSIVVPAIAGPFDLGTVVVRAAINVDIESAKLTVISDPLPLMLKGVPLRVRNITVDINRPNFMLNPTSCAPMRVDATVGAADGRAASVGSRFQVGDCQALPLAPKMALRVGGRGRTRRDITTPLEVTLRQRAGESGLRSVKVVLPKTINARLPVVRRACTLEEFKAERCGANVKVGSALAITPLLRDPLRGDVYFVRNPARRLPDLMVRLKGQIAIDLAGKVTIPRSLQLSTEFDTIPDAPISMFRMRFVAGRNGPVGAVENLCTPRVRRTPAQLSFVGQSGRRVERDQRLVVRGCGKHQSTRRAAARRTASKRGARRSRSTRRSTRN